MSDEQTQTTQKTPDQQARVIQQHFAESTAATLRRDRLLKEITGLGRHDVYTWDRRATLTGAQAMKIEGLKTQMAQMKRGYEKKISKLMRRIAALENAHVINES
jgi:hypothetical protein